MGGFEGSLWDRHCSKDRRICLFSEEIGAPPEGRLDGFGEVCFLSTSSRIEIKFILRGVGEAEGLITKISAPLTAEQVLKSLPIEGRAHPCVGGVSFFVGFKRGEEKSRRNAEAGAVAYWPMSDSLCIFYEKAVFPNPVNIVGTVTKNLELFTSLKSGTSVRIERIRMLSEGR